MPESAAPYPLRFHPVLKRYLWGGNKLGQRYRKPVGPDGVCAESWEVSDLDDAQTIVANGPWAGRSLSRLLVEHETELLGAHAQRRSADLRARPEVAALARFPLLIKLLDAAQPLSVQVHPDSARGALLHPPELGKTEAWYVVEAEPGAKIYAGLQPGVDRQRLAQALASGDVAACLASFEPQAGDCILLPPGTVHALGAGVVVFEVQTPCDVTWRLFDWNRLGADGRPRPLHVREGLEAIDFGLKPPAPRNAVQDRAGPASVCERLLSCEAFVMDRWKVDGAAALATEGAFRVLHVVEGELSVDEHASDSGLAPGDTCLLPAGLDSLKVHGRAFVLDVHLPI